MSRSASTTAAHGIVDLTDDGIGDIEDCCATLAYLTHGPDYHTFQPDEVGALRQDLLAWYDVHRRRLPWRGDLPPFTRSAPTPAKQQKGRKRKRPAAKGKDKRRWR